MAKQSKQPDWNFIGSYKGDRGIPQGPNGQTSGPPAPGSYSGGKVTTRDTSGSGSTGGPAQHPSLDPKLAKPTKTQG